MKPNCLARAAAFSCYGRWLDLKERRSRRTAFKSLRPRALLEDVKRRRGILERCCAEIGRDPSTILTIVSAPVVLVADGRKARKVKGRIPRVEHATTRPPLLPEQAAEMLEPYLDAGISGFTFRNSDLHTPELVQAAGELKQMLAGSVRRADVPFWAGGSGM